MELRPEITLNLSSCTFREYYYLKEELVAFCRDHHLPTSGGKQELTERIACFLDSGMVKQPAAKHTVKHKAVTSEITPERVPSRSSSNITPISATSLKTMQERGKNKW